MTPNPLTPNPLTDVFDFVTTPAWHTAVYVALLLGSLVLAIRAAPRQRPRPGLRDAGICLLRVLVGSMWWQQSLWKIPPDFEGLLHWMGEMADHAAIPLQGELVRSYVIPDIGVFGPIVYGVEVAIGVSLMLGVASQLGALLGLGMAANLWLGLYSAPGEWPWTYVFLMVIQALWVIQPPGFSLGADALIAARRRSPALVARTV